MGWRWPLRLSVAWNRSEWQRGAARHEEAGGVVVGRARLMMVAGGWRRGSWDRTTNDISLFDEGAGLPSRREDFCKVCLSRRWGGSRAAADDRMAVFRPTPAQTSPPSHVGGKAHLQAGQGRASRQRSVPQEALASPAKTAVTLRAEAFKVQTRNNIVPGFPPPIGSLSLDLA